MAQPFLGQISMVGFNFAPIGWQFCNGQLLSIAEFSDLFQIIGTTYGGDGQSTFAVPNLNGRAPLHQGQGPGLSPYVVGETGGEESHTVVLNEYPSHIHPWNAVTTQATVSSPVGAYLAEPPAALGNQFASTGAQTLMEYTTESTGDSQPHENRQPYLVINFIIAVEGVFPAQS